MTLRTFVTIPDSPASFGAPFPSWLTGQREMVEYVLGAEVKHVVLQAGMGRGKSVVAIATAALLEGKRVCILTTSKALSDQYAQDFSSMGYALMKGRNEYPCLVLNVNADEAPCTAKYKCVKQPQCPYYVARGIAQQARVVVTNIAYFLTAQNYAGKALGDFDVVIVDEADLLEGWLLWMAGIRVSYATFGRVLPHITFPTVHDLAVWQDWAREYRQQAESVFSEVKANLEGMLADGVESLPKALQLDYKRCETVADTLKKVLMIPSDERWVVELAKRNADEEEGRSRGWAEIKPVWAAKHAKHLLYDWAKEKVVFMSGTIPDGRQFSKLVGLPDGEWVHREFPCIFPVRNRPCYYVPTVKISHAMTSGDFDMLVARIDRIVQDRLDRKGIIHTGSYRMMEEIYSRSMWGGRDGFFLRHNSGAHNLNDALDKHRKSGAPSVLVSPAIGRGISLPYDECTYIIHARVPWPDMDTEQMKARKEEDKDYAAYVAATSIEQQAFRGLRGPQDVAESFMLDDHWRWFRAAYSRFFSLSFRDSWRTAEMIPAPIDLGEMEAYMDERKRQRNT